MAQYTQKHLYEKWAGYAYLICMISSIMAGIFIRQALSYPQPALALMNNQIPLFLATALDVINAVGILLIAAIFFHFLKIRFPIFSTLYLSLRLIETALCIVIAFVPVFSIYILSKGTLIIDSTTLSLNVAFQLRDVYWAYIYPLIYISSGLLFYYMLLKTKLLPKYISIWGMMGLIGVFISLFMPAIKLIPGLLMITNEIYIGFYLIYKGTHGQFLPLKSLIDQ